MTTHTRSSKAKTKKTSTKAKARKSLAKPKNVRSSAKKSSKKASTRARATSKARKGSATVSSRKGVAESPTAMRLTFSYVGDKVKLISQQPVDMTVPPSDPLRGYKKQKGFWAELKGDQDRTLYRQVMHNPTRNDAEVFSDDPDENISREPAPKRTGVFVVVVPATEKAQEVTLSRSTVSPPAAGGKSKKGMTMGIRSLAAEPATEIARFKLKK